MIFSTGTCFSPIADSRQYLSVIGRIQKIIQKIMIIYLSKYFLNSMTLPGKSGQVSFFLTSYRYFHSFIFILMERIDDLSISENTTDLRTDLFEKCLNFTRADEVKAAGL
ncbi:MAG: hypothetical protein DRP51_02820, partial [Candidatus Zixiibacteriota bacterium]